MAAQVLVIYSPTDNAEADGYQLPSDYPSLAHPVHQLAAARTENIDQATKPRRSLRKRKQPASLSPDYNDESDKSVDGYAAHSEADTDVARPATKKRKPRAKKGDGPRKRVYKPRGKAADWAQEALQGPPGFSFKNTCCPDTCMHTPPDECHILKFLDMVWDPSLGFFICSKHRQIVPPSDLPDHISRKHLTRRQTAQSLENGSLISDHLITKHNSPSLSYGGALYIDHPIEQLGPPEPHYGCPDSACDVWRKGGPQTTTVVILRHCNHEAPHRDDSAFRDKCNSQGITLECRWVQHSKMKSAPRLALVLPVGWSPAVDQIDSTQAPHIARDIAMSSSNAPHLHSLGWIQYRQSLGDVSHRRLSALTELPSEIIVNRCKLLKKTPRMWMERGLLNLSDFAESYFKSATVIPSPGYSRPYSNTIRKK